MASLIQLAQKISGLGYVGLAIALGPFELLTNVFSYSSARRHRLLLAKLIEFLEKLHAEELPADAQCFHHRANLKRFGTDV